MGKILSQLNQKDYIFVDCCQICDGKLGKVILKKSRNGYCSTWVECLQCGSAHIDPYPKPIELKEYYESEYTEMCFDGTADEGVDHKLRFSDDYFETVSAEYSMSLMDVDINPHNLELRYNNILDYGCANGTFLRFLINKNFPKKRIYGSDISINMLNDCKSFTDNLCVSDEIGNLNIKFDLITMWDVIEHIHQPKITLDILVRKLSNKGEILIQTPNYGKLASLMGEEFAHYLVFEHINLLSRSAIIDLFKNFDMTCVTAKSFGANISEMKNQSFVKKAFDKLSKELDFGSTQLLRFKKNDVN